SPVSAMRRSEASGRRELQPGRSRRSFLENDLEQSSGVEPPLRSSGREPQLLPSSAELARVPKPKYRFGSLRLALPRSQARGSLARGCSGAVPPRATSPPPPQRGGREGFRPSGAALSPGARRSVCRSEKRDLDFSGSERQPGRWRTAPRREPTPYCFQVRRGSRLGKPLGEPRVGSVMKIGCLTIIESQEAGKRILLKNLSVFEAGKAQGNHNCLKEDSVAFIHCRVYHSEGTYMVYDLGSRRGTLVNGRPIEKIELSSGDLLQVGDLKLCFEIVDEAETSGRIASSAPDSDEEDAQAKVGGIITKTARSHPALIVIDGDDRGKRVTFIDRKMIRIGRSPN